MTYETMTSRKYRTRMLLSNGEANFSHLVDIAYARAAALDRAHYVVMDHDGRPFVTKDPTGLTILRVCPCATAAE